MSDAGTHLTTRPDSSAEPKHDPVSVATTRLLLVTGDELEIDAALDKVVKDLEDAARSSAGTLARFAQAGTAEPVAVNASHVVAVRPGSQ